MKNLKTYFKHIGSTLMIAMSADGYRITVINDIKNTETDKVIQETVRRSTELSNKLTEQMEQNVINNTEIESSLNNIKNGLETIQKKVDVLNTIETDKSVSNIQQASIDSLKEEAVKVNNVIDKVLEFINSSSNNSNNLTFQDVLDNYYQFFDSLTLIQKGAFAHTLFCIGILFCIYDILVAYYSNKLILYFNLENKYPRLAKYIVLKRKFQDYYIKLNFIIIIILTLFVLYTNIYIFVYAL
jgi:hypothetical protein